jgi:hypothetical protein
MNIVPVIQPATEVVCDQMIFVSERAQMTYWIKVYGHLSNHLDPIYTRQDEDGLLSQLIQDKMQEFDQAYCEMIVK